MSTDKNVQTVKDFFAAIGRGDREALLALVAEDIEWIIPGKDWPLAGTRHGHAGLADLLETASKSMETSTEPREFVAQGDRVLVVGFAKAMELIITGRRIDAAELAKASAGRCRDKFCNPDEMLEAARQEVSRRMAAQLPDEEKIKVADFVIDNSGSLDATEKQVRDVYAQLRTKVLTAT